MAQLPRRVIMGTSVTRLSVTELRDKVPYIIIDGYDNAQHGGTYYQMDGRGLYTPPSHGGLNIWAGYQDEINRGMLRAGTTNRDWAIFEFSRGAENLDLCEPVIDNIIASVLQNNFRLAWVLPHVYFGAKSPDMIVWNNRLRSYLLEKVPQVPDSVLIDWDAMVEAWTEVSPSLTQAQKDQGQPLVYDGRHPTGAAANPGRGCQRLACAIQSATGL